ncbi:hypothetical protein BHF70_07075 [Anaerostipes sp. 494a]|uniref:hypothetical protein n=1 Tax=Anaerostipes sp. 494a TaxID=1261636 RepID=UPI0009534A90|nr:hypothetical protein [Anaerostipes sp. 494a]OLR59402.1 hypothetical protein BHF70_07075 [Anaerostipes sp. 494a]
MREFSIEHFQDTKVFEQISGMVVKIIRRFDSKQKGKDGKEILAEYLHFGDIDAGGYEIYENLCRKTGIPFGMYRLLKVGLSLIWHQRNIQNALKNICSQRGDGNHG